MSTNKSKNSLMNIRQRLNYKSLGNRLPRRNGKFAAPINRAIFKALGWKAVGSLPNVPKAVFLALPHTSNFDGLYAIPLVLGLDLDIKLLGKDTLFKYPIVSSFFKWAGIIPIDRSKKGSVLQATIDQFNANESLLLGLAPEGTRNYTENLKSGFYYIAHGAGVPIIPVAMDYKTKEVRFMEPVYPTGDYEADLEKVLKQYVGVVPKYPEKMAQALQDVNK